ncbi:hypothetical protein [Rhizobium straminoryzae]|uniref:AraC family transcriptional regulator n=1 Tax=Rhizobium straminoryzae TaxID=1387186 RepID=A0A549SLE4_9HYPH|nr:hypothetical protein [Rhizobium straminoryzae]TRL30448.1 hypothetical protein FNA46_25500 [Rhizobium straminoryzae]
MAAGTDYEAGKLSLLSHFPSLRVAPFRRETISAWHVREGLEDGRDVVLHLEARPAYFAMIYLRPVTHCDLLADGSALPPRQYEQGSICLVDLRKGAEIRISTRLDAVGVMLPLSLVEEVTGRFPDLRVRPRLRRNTPDPVIHKLGLALLPFLSGDDDHASPALQHIMAALCIQLVSEQRTVH